MSLEEIDGKLRKLRNALETKSNRVVKAALMNVVPTFKSLEEVNKRAIDAEEMQIASGA